MKAELISIGTEILLGEIVDTNSAYLASQLPLLGLDLYWLSTVGDNRKRLLEVLERAWKRSDVIITTGGLGPTEDDITREGLSDLLNEKAYLDKDLEKWLRDLFSSRNMRMPERNLKQATLIPSSKPLHNSRGTAPGWWIEKERKLIISLPGPPMEMITMWEKEVLPGLKARLAGEVILSTTLKISGMGEAAVDEVLSPLLSSTNPTIGVYAKPDGIHARLTAKAAHEGEARNALDAMEAKVRVLFGDKIWGKDSESLSGVIGSLLKERNFKLASMESCTGGLFASIVTDNPGSSEYFNGGLVAYTRQMKTVWGVAEQTIDKFGMVSAETAKAMAAAARELLKSDAGVGITGVAGPTEMEGKKPGIVYIAVDCQGKVNLFKGNIVGDRLTVKQRGVTAALLELRKALLDMNPNKSA